MFDISSIKVDPNRFSAVVTELDATRPSFGEDYTIEYNLIQMKTNMPDHILHQFQQEAYDWWTMNGGAKSYFLMDVRYILWLGYHQTVDPKDYIHAIQEKLGLCDQALLNPTK